MVCVVCVCVCVCVCVYAQVYGDDRVPVETVLPELVQPVIAGKVDMAMVEYSDKVCACAHVCVCEWPPNGVAL